MSRGTRRRRALILLSLALASGGLAASRVSDTVERVEARVGRPVAVVVARRELAADSRLAPDDLAVRDVPSRFVPRDALESPAQAAGARTSVPLPAGAYVTAGALGSAARRGGGLPRGQRAVEVAVSGGGGLADDSAPGTRVDVLVSTEGRRTFLALQDVELMSIRAQPGEGAADSVATLRVTLRQAVYLTAAENFAREVRLLARPPGDRERDDAAEVAAGEI
jgi:pilus assembly protein CpaB